MEKPDLRRLVRARLDSRTLSQLHDLSLIIQERLSTVDEFRAAGVLASYVGKAGEVETEATIRSALERGARVLVPFTDKRKDRLVFSELHNFDEELVPGTLGILEPKAEFMRPVPLAEADVVLVPLVAWDERGYRLGHGRGYFDRALAPLATAMTIGLAFELQKVDRIPEEPFDTRLRMVVTEDRVLRTGNR